MEEDSAVLDQEIAAFEAARPDLEQKYTGKWVVFKGQKMTGPFDSLDAAATDAISKYGRGPYLIRQVGVSPSRLTAALMSRQYAAS